jgi:hypothetical protein
MDGDGWDKYLNNFVTVFYDDNASVSRKYGKLLSISDSFVLLKTENNSEIAIAVSRVIRIEMGEKL